MDLTIFGKNPLIIDSEMWFLFNAGRLKSFLTLSKADKSLISFLVLLKERKKQTWNPFAPRSLRVDLTGAEFIEDYFVELEQIFCQ